MIATRVSSRCVSRLVVRLRRRLPRHRPIVLAPSRDVSVLLPALRDFSAEDGTASRMGVQQLR